MGRYCRRGLLEKYHLSLTTPVCVAAVKLINAFITTRHFFPLPTATMPSAHPPQIPLCLKAYWWLRAPPQMFMGNISQIFNHSFNHSLSTVIFLYCILFMYLHFVHNGLRSEGRRKACGAAQLPGQRWHFHSQSSTHSAILSLCCMSVALLLKSGSALTAITFTFPVSLSSDSDTFALAVTAGSLSTDCREVAG